jgi:hypothetical protein
VDTLPDEPKFDAATCILVEHLQPDNGAKLHLLEGIHRRMVSGGWFVLFGLHGNLRTENAMVCQELWAFPGAENPSGMGMDWNLMLRVTA